MSTEHAQFSGSIPAAYDRYLGSILFEPYAEDLTNRLKVGANASVLELACGTGILTRMLRSHLPATVKLIATDLNEPMFQHAATKFQHDEEVEWLQADASSLPFGDEMFDAVVCQFGIMFFPDKALAAREAYRVLKPDGLFLFNVWDALDHNPLGQLTHQAIARFFEKDPPNFYETPFGYHDQSKIKQLLEEAGFSGIRVEVVDKIGTITRASDAAKGLINGNPVGLAIVERDLSLLPVIEKAVAQAITDRFGGQNIRVPMKAIVAQGKKV